MSRNVPRDGPGASTSYIRGACLFDTVRCTWYSCGYVWKHDKSSLALLDPSRALGTAMFALFLLAEHRGRKTSPLVYENTRTMHYTPWIYRKLAWNMPFHMEHHAWPSIPFHQLGRAHDLLTQAAAVQDADNAESTKTSLLDQGEVQPGFVGCGKKGYIAFNWRLFKRLLQQEKS
jgi:fatty acid desaturase